MKPAACSSWGPGGFAVCPQVIGQVSIGLCWWCGTAVGVRWWQHESCIHAMKAVRLPGAVTGTGGVSLHNEALCPAVSGHSVSQTIFSTLFFFNGASLALLSSQLPTIFGWKALPLLQAKLSHALVFTFTGDLMTHVLDERMPESLAGALFRCGAWSCCPPHGGTPSPTKAAGLSCLSALSL